MARQGRRVGANTTGTRVSTGNRLKTLGTSLNEFLDSNEVQQEEEDDSTSQHSGNWS
jgi:hypothetical protein